ncbi:DUF1707 SHOCT-like domain-containing protein [Jiangella rhizosphaerae]|uniref:DUF1707 domain-containing protein n=1 Tax=Jiangella rhizosphaerae TaxID=2293569 RepID=A0A418KS85_9ACTN|nr:DUF1707 domain-containing protein [Jiangella rhizosphaerae]RIQ25231.1 DUF1707 domain-containing protein [Jiangella rhizosphaerae]
MSRPDRRWRPSDADRDRYAAAISQAFAEGRIDTADMESRTALVHEAKSIAELDALVEDMPPPAPAPTPEAPVSDRHETRRALLFATALTIGAIVVAAIVGAVLYNALGDDASSSSPRPVAEAPEPEEIPPPDEPAPLPVEDVELPPIDTEQVPMFTLEGLQELWAAAARTVPSDISLYADRASLRVRSDSARRGLDTVEYQGGLLLPREPYRDLSDGEPDDEVFFSWDDVAPEAVAAAIAGMPAALGVADVPIGHISIGHFPDGEVSINVYPEGDIGPTYVRWDATGQRVLGVY